MNWRTDMPSRKTRTFNVVLAGILASCAIPGAAGIMSALDNGETDRALDLAKGDQRSLDLLAMEIIGRAAIDPQTRDEGLAALCRTGPRARPVLRDLSTASDPLVKVTAWAMLYKRGDRTYEEGLTAALDSELGLVRAQAVDALLAMDQGRAFHERYMLDVEPSVRLSVVTYLKDNEMPWSQLLLADAARRDPDDAVRTAAVAGLDPKDEASRDLLRESLSDGDRGIRLAAVSALGTDPASADLTWAAHLLVLPASEEGIGFASSLLATKEGNDKASTYLTGALGNPSPKIRLCALLALGVAGKKVEGLDDLGSDPSDQVRVAWCRLTRKLGTSEQARRMEILEAIVGESSDAPRLEAWLAMSEEKGGYAKVRAKVWNLLVSGPPPKQRYVLLHAVRPFADPSLAIRGMRLEDLGARLAAAATWLSR